MATNNKKIEDKKKFTTSVNHETVAYFAESSAEASHEFTPSQALVHKEFPPKNSSSTRMIFKWTPNKFPDHERALSPWVEAAKEWFAFGIKKDTRVHSTLVNFFEHFLLGVLAPRGLPIDIKGFLKSPDQISPGTYVDIVQKVGGIKNFAFEKSAEIPTFFEVVSPRAGSRARTQNNKLHEFLNFVLQHLLEATFLTTGRLVTDSGLKNPIPYIDTDGLAQPSKIANRQSSDFTWVAQQTPQLEAWRLMAVQWLSQQRGDKVAKLSAFSKFFTYLARADMRIAADPVIALSRSTNLPEFLDIIAVGGKGATGRPRRGGVNLTTIVHNNLIADFIDWVLLSDNYGFSSIDDYGRRQVEPAFHNFVTRRSLEGMAGNYDSSVRQALPFGLIHQAKKILIQGPNFQDWTWCHRLLGAQEGEIGKPGRDWFEVPEQLIDEADPDCVFSRRIVRGQTVVKMWSPVRYVVLALKLILPLRTMQIRFLDSGEADTWQYHKLPGQHGSWILNRSNLAEGNEKKPLAQGAISRWTNTYSGEVGVQLYINTNKTNDRSKGGAAKGYRTVWPENVDPLEDVYYWLNKLRVWQEKYNPINRRTCWTELQGKAILQEKDMATLSSYSDACFLFRAPEISIHPHLPIKLSAIGVVWEKLLKSLQDQLTEQGATHADGSPIELVAIGKRPMLHKETGKTHYVVDLAPHYDLHSLRVSLITCLAWDGEVPFSILQTLAGHSRLLMTLYYFKPGQREVQQVLQAAQDRLKSRAQASIISWLKNGEHRDLEQRAIAVNSESLRRIIPINPAHRNPSGWMEMADGVCMAGGNTSSDEVNAQTPGCHNGGPNLGKPSQPTFVEVPGGARNCPRCRWFVTEPHHLPALIARFNNTAFHFDNSASEVSSRNRELEELRKGRADAEASGTPFLGHSEIKRSERLLELHVKNFDERCHDLAAIWKLIKRAIDILNSDDESNPLILATNMTGLEVAIEESAGELLQLAWVCENVEVYPDLNPGTAVLRRTQLLDIALERDGLPTAFMRLSPTEQLKVGNAFMRRLSERMNPDDRWIGMRKVVEHMEAGGSLIGLPGVHEALQAVTGTGVKLLREGPTLRLGV